MILIKRLHLFVLKTFLPLFAMTFFIVLFIVLMQFLWKYIDDLVGKGLGIDVLGELFFYAAVSMVPMALPLAILLASLMTFGNLGEKFELTAMKASGIPLIKVMMPLIVTVSMIAVGAFFFQNDVLPRAQVKMWTLLFSMRQKSPELEIPEDVFYDQIPGFNLYVKDKDKTTGMLRQVMIYDVSNGGENATIITSDSARLAFTPDSKYLYLHLYKGEQFENLRDQNSRKSGINTPFRRESFHDKQVLIPFDANFNRIDEGGMKKQYIGKNMEELLVAMDSINARIDSIGESNLPILKESELSTLTTRVVPSQQQSQMIQIDEENAIRMPATASNTVQREIKNVAPLRIDTLLKKLSDQEQGEVYANALNISKRRQDLMSFRAQVMEDEKKVLRRNDIELIKKFTLSVACLIFFFIGAPLGAIIRKGGLGTPLVISVLLFVFYYIIDNTGYKMARDGKMAVWAGMWLSTFVLAPLGAYVTWKAMNDSAVFDFDAVKNRIRKLLGIRGSRSVASKEVIINDIDDAKALEMLLRLASMATDVRKMALQKISYRRYLSEGLNAKDIMALGKETDTVVEYLTDCRNPQVIALLGDFPVISDLWIYRPSKGRKWLGIILQVFFPLGLALYTVQMFERKNLKANCNNIIERCKRLYPFFGYEEEKDAKSMQGAQSYPESASMVPENSEEELAEIRESEGSDEAEQTDAIQDEP